MVIIVYDDIRKEREGVLTYDFSNIETFLNMQSVKDALGVEKSFASFSHPVYEALKGDCAKNSDEGIPALLDKGIKLLIYVGDEDLMCDWIGNFRWVLELNWSGKEGFTRNSVIQFIVDDELVELLTKYGPLTFIKVFQTGHMISMDQPKTTLYMTGHHFK
ncbi:serine carboxypeptidase-like [Tripterygium wilfordii]|uniref:serine carboxypeptidase-like n=1 Tax=Tripterygium wilfordii TaxID=458696 RepID=UPI0018F838DE|nr:serine carboxypeptidase-like [Tripterygium wilfordii]